MDYSNKNRRSMSEALQPAKLKDEAIAFVQGLPPRRTPVAVETTSSAAGTMSMTFRLPAALAAQLIRTATERKLNRQHPFTQQEIVAESILAWLKNQSHSE